MKETGSLRVTIILIYNIYIVLDEVPEICCTVTCLSHHLLRESTSMLVSDSDQSNANANANSELHTSFSCPLELAQLLSLPDLIQNFQIPALV